LHAPGHTEAFVHFALAPVPGSRRFNSHALPPSIQTQDANPAADFFMPTKPGADSIALNQPRTFGYSLNDTLPSGACAM
jgi:hypothetical protein